jgi:hypothetical protein
MRRVAVSILDSWLCPAYGVYIKSVVAEVDPRVPGPV